MALLEYILVALLGSTGAAAPGGTRDGGSAPTFNAESIVQPNGGVAGEYFQKKPGKDEGTTPPAKSHARRRHHRTHHRRGHRSTADSGKKATKQ
jgi:hypothetical protein